MKSASERADERRRTWSSGRATIEERATLGLAFWREASGVERMDAVVALAIESEILKGREPPTGFHRSVGGIRRRES